MYKQDQMHRHYFYQIQLYLVMWAAITITWFEGEKYWIGKMPAENTDREIACQPGSCEPGKRSWEPETSLKNAAGIFKVQLGT